MDGENPYRHPEAERTPKQESKKDDEFPVNLRLLLLRKAGTWDTSPVLTARQTFPPATKYKETIGNDNNCMHAQLGQNTGNTMQKDQKAQLPLLKSCQEGRCKSRGLSMPPAHKITKGWAKHLSHSTALDTPNPHPVSGSSPPSPVQE